MTSPGSVASALRSGLRYLAGPWPWRALVWCVLGGLTGSVLLIALIAGVWPRARAAVWPPLLELEAARLSLIDPAAARRLQDELRRGRDAGRPLGQRQTGYLAATSVLTGPIGFGLVTGAGMALGVLLAAPWLSAPADPITVGPWHVHHGAEAWTAACLGVLLLVAALYLVGGYATLVGQLAELTLTDPAALRREVTRLGDSRAALLQATEQERRRIESELHDRVQHRLVALAMSLGIVESTQDGELRELAADTHRQLDEVLAELRSVLLGIQPRALTEHGLIAAVTDLIGPYPLRVECDFGATEAGGRLTTAVEQVAYLVINESLTNVVKHAHARTVTIEADRDGDTWRLTVRDDGRGAATVRPGGGLDTLAARVAALDGTLEVHSPEGGPTEIRMRCPSP